MQKYKEKVSRQLCMATFLKEVEEFSQLEHVAREACRKNNLLRINVHKR